MNRIIPDAAPQGGHSTHTSEVAPAAELAEAVLVYRVHVRGVRKGERPYGIRDQRHVFTLTRFGHIVGAGPEWVKFGGWPSETFDDRDRAAILAVVADEHRLICESRGHNLPHLVEWFVDDAVQFGGAR